MRKIKVSDEMLQDVCSKLRDATGEDLRVFKMLGRMNGYSIVNLNRGEVLSGGCRIDLYNKMVGMLKGVELCEE